jgi:hypothetical protein
MVSLDLIQAANMAQKPREMAIVLYFMKIDMAEVL